MRSKKASRIPYSRAKRVQGGLAGPVTAAHSVLILRRPIPGRCFLLCEQRSRFVIDGVLWSTKAHPVCFASAHDPVPVRHSTWILRANFVGRRFRESARHQVWGIEHPSRPSEGRRGSTKRCRRKSNGSSALDFGLESR